MALIDDLNSRLKRYHDAEQRIIEQGQSVTDEDGRQRREGSLKEIRAGIDSLQIQINRISFKRPRLRQYGVKV